MADRLLSRPADAGEHRQERVNLRLSGDEAAVVRQAAAGTRETVSGYAARILVLAACGELDGGADPAEVRELAHLLIRVRRELHEIWALLDDAIATASSTGDQDGQAAAVEACDSTRQLAEQATRAVLDHLDRWRRRLASASAADLHVWCYRGWSRRPVGYPPSYLAPSRRPALPGPRPRPSCPVRV